jgi:hypothetical protein
MNRGYMVVKIFTCLHNVNLVAIRACISRAERDSIELLLIGKGGICRGNNKCSKPIDQLVVKLKLDKT